MKKIILDTNFLLLPFTRKIDVFSEIERIMYDPYKIIVLKKTVDELKKIQKEQKGKHKHNAKAALDLIKAKKPIILEVKQKDLNRTVNSKDVIADDIIMEISDKNTIVATNDKNLQKNLKNKNIKLLILKKKTLEIKDVL